MTRAATPRMRVQLACRRFGHDDVVRRCIALVRGGSDDGDLIAVLGGSHATQLLADGVPDDQAYWIRVWAMRGLLWAGPGDDVDVLRTALRDESWRVREMTCKVIARHQVGDVLEECGALSDDKVARVRAAAERAVTRIIAAGA